MGITIFSHTLADQFQDVRHMIDALDELLPPRSQGKLRLAKDLIGEAEDDLIAAGDGE